jgi:N-carbamoyl-L-amino-acid hydrolase
MPDTIAPNLVAAVDEARQWDRLMQLGRLGGFTDAAGMRA